ncbi:uncharacterized protein LOC125570247 [Nematostella vectensis]|uniref:uncharacterized protein LOC125570247 n=1 Tax=Nematostella vectensis TaxID=45351 RepID=UPI0020776611|nr:uncharacterized protein LOC125570247 [Nematostella vectensis]
MKNIRLQGPIDDSYTTEERLFQLGVTQLWERANHLKCQFHEGGKRYFQHVERGFCIKMYGRLTTAACYEIQDFEEEMISSHRREVDDGRKANQTFHTEKNPPCQTRHCHLWRGNVQNSRQKICEARSLWTYSKVLQTQNDNQELDKISQEVIPEWSGHPVILKEMSMTQASNPVKNYTLCLLSEMARMKIIGNAVVSHV